MNEVFSGCLTSRIAFATLVAISFFNTNMFAGELKQQDQRIEIPSIADQRQAKQQIGRVYSKQLSSTKPADLAKTARLLLDDAKKTANSATRYQMIQIAANIFLQIGELPGFENSVQLLANEFKLDFFEALNNGLGKAAELAGDASSARELAEFLTMKIESRIVTARFEEAKQLLMKFQVLSRRSNNRRLQDEAKALTIRVRRCKKLTEDFLDAKEDLAQSSDDRSANQKVGEYYAVVTRDYVTSLGFLAKGVDKELASAIAFEERNGVTAKLVEFWFEKGKKGETAIEQVFLLKGRALLDDLTQSAKGIEKRSMEKRLNQVDSLLEAVGLKGVEFVNHSQNNKPNRNAKLAQLMTSKAWQIKWSSGPNWEKSVFKSNGEVVNQIGEKDRPNKWKLVGEEIHINSVDGKELFIFFIQDGKPHGKKYDTKSGKLISRGIVESYADKWP